LADCTRDEIQAVAAHELAHILRGDALYVTFVCSLVNVFERLREFFEPSTATSGDTQHRDAAGGSLIYVAAWLSSTMMLLFSALLSRQREFMADAAAVELCRDPMALSRAIYKANTRYSQVGGTSDVYSPIFIVDPRSVGLEDDSGFFGRLFGSHPAAMKRIERLAAMAGKRATDVLGEIRDIQKERSRNKTVIKHFVSSHPEQDAGVQSEDPTWLACDGKGQWHGPYRVEELVFLPFFTTRVRVRNLIENQAGLASDFKPIVELLNRAGTHARHPDSNQCPRCKVALSQSLYEGTTIHACARCGGKYLNTSALDKILVRRDVVFDETLCQKAREFRDTVLLNPLKRKPGREAASPMLYTSPLTAKQVPKSPQSETLLCPTCSAMMIEHPFSYQYFVPVFKCLLCRTFWFDPDNLEILQILVESNRETEF
ncbi:MAG TPA: zinc metalloprotease HtpX, partial [bacterium]|nr:zinc metalloprotease HtpX [bacterium]